MTWLGIWGPSVALLIALALTTRALVLWVRARPLRIAADERKQVQRLKKELRNRLVNDLQMSGDHARKRLNDLSAIEDLVDFLTEHGSEFAIAWITNEQKTIDDEKRERIGRYRLEGQIASTIKGQIRIYIYDIRGEGAVLGAQVFDAGGTLKDLASAISTEEFPAELWLTRFKDAITTTQQKEMAEAMAAASSRALGAGGALLLAALLLIVSLVTRELPSPILAPGPAAADSGPTTGGGDDSNDDGALDTGGDSDGDTGGEGDSDADGEFDTSDDDGDGDTGDGKLDTNDGDGDLDTGDGDSGGDVPVGYVTVEFRSRKTIFTEIKVANSSFKLSPHVPVKVALPPGHHDIFVTRKDGAQHIGSVEIAEGEQRLVEISGYPSKGYSVQTSQR